MIPELRCYVQQYSIQIPILSLPPQDIDDVTIIQEYNIPVPRIPPI